MSVRGSEAGLMVVMSDRGRILAGVGKTSASLIFKAEGRIVNKKIEVNRTVSQMQLKGKE